MFQDDYRRMMDAVSPSPALERRTEREIHNMLHSRSKGRVRRSACIAAVAALLTLSMAFAAVQSSGILSRLFPGDRVASQAAQEAVVRDSMQLSRDGVTLNMDEYLFDRNTLHLGWTLSSEREKPVYCTTSYDISYADPADAQLAANSIGGQLGASSSVEIGDGVLLRLSRERSANSGYVSYGYAAAIAGTVNAKLTVHVYETDWAEEQLSAASVWQFSDDPALAAELEQRRAIGLTTDGMTRIEEYPAYIAALDALLDEGMDFDAACEAAIANCGAFTEVAVLEMNVSVDPSRAAAPRFVLDGERSYELDGATVILKNVSINTASTIIEYDLITAQPIDTETYGGQGLSLLIFDQDGNPLTEACSLDMYGLQMTDEDGNSVDGQGRTRWQITISGKPIPESVTALTFVEYLPLERIQESSSDYFRRIADSAAPNQRFTLELN